MGVSEKIRTGIVGLRVLAEMIFQKRSRLWN